ncbi:hypothetical protein FBU30_003700 [Linnemannia zychae]|nr:hypothetical protein FBU30_003700 [Linnemannia zychae]
MSTKITTAEVTLDPVPTKDSKITIIPSFVTLSPLDPLKLSYLLKSTATPTATTISTIATAVVESPEVTTVRTYPFDLFPHDNVKDDDTKSEHDNDDHDDDWENDDDKEEEDNKNNEKATLERKQHEGINTEEGTVGDMI